MAGEVVRLKSGGPRMTVVERRSGGIHYCQWFDGATLKGDFFLDDCFVVVGPESVTAEPEESP